MRVRIPIAGNPASPQPGGIMSFVTGLGVYLAQNGIEVEYLCAGGAGDASGCHLVSIAPEGSGEFNFSRRLALFVRTTPDHPRAVYIANTELYAWALRGIRATQSLILILHGPTLPTLKLRRPLASLPFRLFVESLAFEIPNTIVAVDTESSSYVLERNPRAHLKQIALPVDTNHFAPQDRARARKQWRIGADPALLYVGRLAPEKNLGLVTDVYRGMLESIPNASIIVAGAGPLEGTLREAQREFGADRFRMAGSVSRMQLPSLYTAADALLLTSRIEQLPNVLLESLSCGTQVVATDVGDVRLILKDPVLGAICHPTVESFVRALSTRFPENDSDRAKYSPIRRSAAALYSWERLGPRFREVIDEAFSP